MQAAAAAQRQSKFAARIVPFRAAEQPAKEKCYRDGCQCGLEHRRSEAVAVAAPQPAAPKAAFSASADVSLAFPPAAMYGILGELAQQTEMPRRKPYHGYSAQYHMLRPAAKRAGLGPIGWHSLRHSYRTWLDETGASISVQRELMRHSTITMTMDGYGRGVASANRKANARVVEMLLGEGEQHGSEQSVQ